MARPSITALFPTRLYRAEIAAPALNRELAQTCLMIAQEDRAGQRWCRKHRYKGYTSYASLDDLITRATAFADLKPSLDRHVARFAGKKLRLDSIWVNVMQKGSVHAMHAHPKSLVSGTYYVSVPKGAAAIRFEDPRLGLSKEHAAKPAAIAPKPGTILLWDSWLRHEVPPNAAHAPRISISFNYAAL